MQENCDFFLLGLSFWGFPIKKEPLRRETPLLRLTALRLLRELRRTRRRAPLELCGAYAPAKAAS